MSRESKMGNGFAGRVIQYIDALDFGDAVSNQVLRIDAVLRSLGYTSLICSKWHHSSVAERRVGLDDIALTELDVAIVHFVGFSEHVVPHVLSKRCTRILVYHNVTPHHFFDKDSALHEFCRRGRLQLVEVLPSFHSFWGDSKFNVEELQSLGVNPARTHVVPILVGEPSASMANAAGREPGAWMFLGRIAPNKGQVELVELFSRVRTEQPAFAQKLYLVGSYDRDDQYYQGLCSSIRELGLEENVVVSGKVGDEEVKRYFCESTVYVSASKHEGFGVPLIEAAFYRLPVVALSGSAVDETLGGVGVAPASEDLALLAKRVQADDEFRAALLVEQGRNAERFDFGSVSNAVEAALHDVLPKESPFRTLSIVICTLNRADYLSRCLDYLQYQTERNFEVVVVNGPSTDGTEEVLEAYRGKIKRADNPLKNLSVSRNIGIEMASGDLVAFIDDDALPFDDWVAELLREFNRRPLTLAGLGGPVYYAGTLEFQMQDVGINKFAEAYPNIESERIGTDGIHRSLLGTNTCFRTDILRELGGFDEQFDYFLDESELCFRLQERGFIVGYSSDVLLRHEFAQSENRGGRFKFNWYTICKNTAYFISAYSGLAGGALDEYLRRRMQSERIQPLRDARDCGELDASECARYVDDIERGWLQGVEDSKNFPRLRTLECKSDGLLLYKCRAEHPLVGVEIKRLHVCIITKEFVGFAGGGGIGTLYYHLASELLLMGHRVTVITPGESDDVYRRGRFSVRYSKVHPVCTGGAGATSFVANANWACSALSVLAVAHAEYPVDVVEGALWDTETLAVALLESGERPAVVTRLVTPFAVAAATNAWAIDSRDADLLRQSERTLIGRSDAVVAISQSIADTIEKEHSLSRDERWTIAHCGIAYWPFFDFRDNYSEWGLGGISGEPIRLSEKIVLFVGRLESRKGVGVLLAGARDFLASDRDACLVFAGRDVEGWRKRVEEFLDGELLQRTHFLGAVSDSVREQLLHRAYCVVFPSRYESFGLVPLEAFVHGVPIVGARAGAIPEVVSDGVSGLLFDPDNASELARKVIDLLESRALREKLSDGAKREILHFSSRKMASAAVQTYVSAIGRISTRVN